MNFSLHDSGVARSIAGLTENIEHRYFGNEADLNEAKSDIDGTQLCVESRD